MEAAARLGALILCNLHFPESLEDSFELLGSATGGVAQTTDRGRYRAVRLGQAEIRPQQVDQALAKPFGVQPPFAAGVRSTGRRPALAERDSNAFSSDSPAAALDPEPVELQLAPQQARQPTSAPLPRTMQAHFGQAQPHHEGVVRRHHLATILGKQGQRPGPPTSVSNAATARPPPATS